MLRHRSEESWEEGLQSLWWRKTSNCKGNTLNWRRCWNWLQHLSDMSTRRTESAKKAVAARHHKNKGHTKGSTKEISIFCRKLCFTSVAKESMERWLSVIALYCMSSGVVPPWLPGAVLCSRGWMILTNNAIFAREYYRDNSYEWFFKILRTVLSCTLLAFQAPNPRSQAPTWLEHLRTLVGGQLPQGQGNLSIFVGLQQIPTLSCGWGWGFTLTPVLVTVLFFFMPIKITCSH